MCSAGIITLVDQYKLVLPIVSTLGVFRLSVKHCEDM